MNIFIALCCLVGMAQAVSVLDEWSAFKTDYGKRYENDAEENLRKMIFTERMDRVNKHNMLYEQGLVTYKQQINRFSDLLIQEMALMKDFNTTYLWSKLKGETFVAPSNVEIAESVDWRTKGAVTPVKNQGYCGSCWAFSSTGAVEGQQFLKSGKLVSLSEQNLVDCNEKNDGCRGGLMDSAFQYIIDNGGIDTEESYPYEGKEGSCRYNPNHSGATVSRYVYIKKGNEEDLKKAVATVGPVSVAIAVSDNMLSYHSGVFYDPACGLHLDHAVLAVGYGTENGQDYWLVKNSWGEKWGDKGYIKMARNKNNNCAITNYAVYPVV